MAVTSLVIAIATFPAAAQAGEHHGPTVAPGRIELPDGETLYSGSRADGGPGREVRAQDADTGEVQSAYAFPSATDRFVNDLTVTDSGVYATERSKELLVVPLTESRHLPDPGAVTLLPLTGDLVMATGSNLNGIASSGSQPVYAVDARFGTTGPETAAYWITRADAYDDRPEGPGKHR